jgi:16S rRNA processing protein RimM
MSGSRVLLAAITGAHGVSGRVRLKTFTEEPDAVGSYGPLSDEAGEQIFNLKITGATKDGVIAEIEGVRKREAAEALKGLGLYVDRAVLPDVEDEDDFYHADLIGLAVKTRDGRRLGVIRAIHDFGAGDVLDVKPAKGGGTFLPFTRETVTAVDIAGGKIIVELPDEMDVHDDADDDPEDVSKETSEEGAEATE